MRMRRTSSLGALAALGVLLASSAALAYVLPADYLLKLLLEKRHELKLDDLSVQLNVEDIAAGTNYDEHLFLKRPGRGRRLQEGDAALLYVESEGARAVGTDQALKRLKGPPTDLTTLFFAPPREKFIETSLAWLANLGIDTTVTALGREADRTVYIIGARPWEPDTPQLWLNKGSFLPVRLLAAVKENGTTVLHETRWLEYGSAAAGNWFPRVIEEYRAGVLARRAEVVQVKTNQKLPESLFQLP